MRPPMVRVLMILGRAVISNPKSSMNESMTSCIACAQMNTLRDVTYDYVKLKTLVLHELCMRRHAEEQAAVACNVEIGVRNGNNQYGP